MCGAGLSLITAISLLCTTGSIALTSAYNCFILEGFYVNVIKIITETL